MAAETRNRSWGPAWARMIFLVFWIGGAIFAFVSGRPLLGFAAVALAVLQLVLVIGLMRRRLP
ncbi:hypothetical protein [Actinoplanes sp. HUAS TT8]|uniref:hypothetical protein n=1 Tax=Actinoplanes sp. HUAS TT8 TaxID=3447453 RepID=UPI003F51C6B7